MEPGTQQELLNAQDSAVYLSCLISDTQQEPINAQNTIKDPYIIVPSAQQELNNVGINILYKDNLNKENDFLYLTIAKRIRERSGFW